METTEEHRLALLNHGKPVDQQDNFFVYLLMERLPIETRKSWENSTPGREPQRYDQLKNYLEERCQALATSLRSTSIGNQQPTGKKVT